MNLEALAHEALAALLAQKHVNVTHPKGWERDGFPLPWTRMKPKADGSVTQPYRPLAILEYVHEKLSRPNKPKSATPRCSVCGKPQFETPGGMTCPDGHGGADSMDDNLFGEAAGEDLFGGADEPNLFS